MPQVLFSTKLVVPGETARFQFRAPTAAGDYPYLCTFPAHWPFIRFPPDPAFVSRHFLVAAFEVLPHIGSDHCPVYARLTLSRAPAADAYRPPPAAGPRDEREAAEKIARAT